MLASIIGTKKIKGGTGLHLGIGITSCFAYILFMQFSTNAEDSNKSLTINFVDLITSENLAHSKSEAKLLISQNAVSINGVSSNSETNMVHPNDIIRVGRRRFLKIVEG